MITNVCRNFYIYLILILFTVSPQSASAQYPIINDVIGAMLANGRDSGNVKIAYCDSSKKYRLDANISENETKKLAIKYFEQAASNRKIDINSDLFASNELWWTNRNFKFSGNHPEDKFLFDNTSAGSKIEFVRFTLYGDRDFSRSHVKIYSPDGRIYQYGFDFRRKENRWTIYRVQVFDYPVDLAVFTHSCGRPDAFFGDWAFRFVEPKRDLEAEADLAAFKAAMKSK